jgi:hypothetical protein
MYSDWYDSYDGYSCNPNEWVDRDDHDDDLDDDFDGDFDYEDF